MKLFTFLTMTWVSLSLCASGLKGFCFERNVSIRQVKGHVSTIKAPADKIYLRESLNCIEMNIDNSREDLFRKWISRRFKIIRQYSGNSNGAVITKKLIRGQCNMKLRRVGKGQSETDNYQLGKSSKASKTISNNKNERVSTLVLTEGLRGSLSINGNRVELVCNRAGATYYQLDVFTTDQSGNEISTNVSVNKGRELNIGQVVENLDNSSTNLDINQGIGRTKTQGNIQYDYFISIQ